jgi:DNA recombination protein RmuC
MKVLKWQIEKENEMKELRKEIHLQESHIQVLEAKEIELREENKTLTQQLEAERKRREEAEKNIVALQEDIKNVNKLLETEKKHLTEVKEQMRQEFKIVANEILKSNSEQFSESSKKNLNALIDPLKEKLEKFEKKVEDTYEKGIKDQSDLKAEMKKIYELSKQLDKDAKNLTKALRTDTKQQGNWGEVVLERILEESGLRINEEYFLQVTGKNINGDKIRPDVIIKLPGNKFLIIDAKVSLTAYQEYINAEDNTQKQKALKRHLESVKNHIKILSEKNYPSFQGKNTPDFVLMFMPVEPAFALAVQSDHSLFSFAWERKVVIVSPTTLLATLRTIESIWRHEKQTKNALEIAKQAGSLYDKFVRFLNDLNNIGENIKRTQSAYEEAKKKLTEGKGNLVSQVEKLKILGAKAQKEIDKNLLER